MKPTPGNSCVVFTGLNYIALWRTGHFMKKNNAIKKNSTNSTQTNSLLNLWDVLCVLHENIILHFIIIKCWILWDVQAKLMWPIRVTWHARNKKLTPHSFQFGSWSFIQKWQTIEKLCVYSCPTVWIQHYEKCSLFNGKVWTVKSPREAALWRHRRPLWDMKCHPQRSAIQHVQHDGF